MINTKGKNPTVSVTIPTYNRAGYVVKAIDSVLAQTYKDYEIIVVDDGSTDNTREVLSLYKDKIRYFYQENKGASAARNFGISKSKGKWIAFLDSDDFWLPEKLEWQFKAISMFSDKAEFCFTNCRFIGNKTMDSTSFKKAGLSEEKVIGIIDDPPNYYLSRQNPGIYVQSILIKRTLLNGSDDFDECLTVGEDSDFIFRMAHKTKFCYVSIPLIQVNRSRHRGTGLTDLLHRKENVSFLCVDYMYNRWLKLIKESDKGKREIILNRLKKLYYSWLIAKLYKFNFKEALQKTEKINELGDSYTIVLKNVFFRAFNKLPKLISNRID